MPTLGLENSWSGIEGKGKGQTRVRAVRYLKAAGRSVGPKFG